MNNLRLLFLALVLLWPAAVSAEEVMFRDMQVDKTLDSLDSTAGETSEHAIPAAFSNDSLYTTVAGNWKEEPAHRSAQNQNWEIGAEMYHMEYREPDAMHNNGWLKGVYAAYTFRGWMYPSPAELDRWMLRLEGRVCLWTC